MQGTAFDQQIKRNIINNLRTLNLYQSHMKDGWRLLASPMEYKSILGLMPKYRHINRLLYNNRFHNPALGSGLYQLDLQTLQCLKKIILVAQKQHVSQIRGWLQSVKSVIT